MFDKQKLLKELFSTHYKNELEQYLVDKHWEILDDDPERFDGEWNSNPYGVEPQLASGSGCYEYSEGAEETAFEEAKESLLLAVEEEDFCFLPKAEELTKMLEDYNNTDIEWVKAIFTHIINTCE